MFFYALSGLINAITSTFLGLFVYFKNRKARVNQIFALFCLSVAVWSYCYYFWPGAQDKATVLFWFRALHIGAIFIPITYLHFVLLWLNLYQEKKRVLKLGYLAAFILCIFDFSPLFIKDMVPKFWFEYWAEPGILYHFFLFIFFTYAIYAFYLLFKAYRKSLGIQRAQIKYLLIGTAIGYLGGATNYPLWYNIPILPLGNFLVTVYVVLVACAIIKRELFGIKILLTTALVSLIAFLLGLDLFIFTPELISKLYKALVLVIFLYFGYLLVKSVIKEIEMKEEIKRAYDVEKKARGEVERLTEAKTQFIMATQHHLRTPLTSMIGYLDLIFGGTYGKFSQEIKKTLLKFQVSTKRLIRVVNELLDISQFQMGKKVVSLKPGTDILPIVEEVIEELQFEIKARNLYLKFQKPTLRQAQGGLPKIKADSEKLKVALFNIIDNAIKYTRKGGITVKLQRIDSKVQISIKDTGIGISKGEAGRLFKAVFERGEGAKKLYTTGKGIGLFVTGHIVKAHKGKVWAESEGPGKGSTFYVELPVG